MTSVSHEAILEEVKGLKTEIAVHINYLKERVDKNGDAAEAVKNVIVEQAVSNEARMSKIEGRLTTMENTEPDKRLSAIEKTQERVIGMGIGAKAVLATLAGLVGAGALKLLDTLVGKGMAIGG